MKGLLRWPALEKANFIAKLIDRGWSYKQVADILGSFPKHIERHYVAHQIIHQASQEGLPGTEKMEGAFGVLLRALQAGGIARFLGVDYPGDAEKSREPVPTDRRANLKHFIEWTFGTEEKAPVIRDSRQLTKWGKILQSREAVRYLKSAPDPRFDRAWFKSGGQKEALADALYAAADRLEESVPIIPEHKSDHDVVEAVKRCTLFFKQILHYFPDIAEQHGVKLTDV